MEATDFYPRSPCGERRQRNTKRRANRGFLSTLSLRRATVIRTFKLAKKDISIHALLAESDAAFVAINPFALLFLSTLSLRRATLKLGMCAAFIPNFYPRSPCGERQHQRRYHQQGKHFYPRSPCGERQGLRQCARQNKDFYPRSPCGERLRLWKPCSM